MPFSYTALGSIAANDAESRITHDLMQRYNRQFDSQTSLRELDAYLKQRSRGLFARFFIPRAPSFLNRKQDLIKRKELAMKINEHLNNGNLKELSQLLKTCDINSFRSGIFSERFATYLDVLQHQVDNQLALSPK